jgi:FkbM family methyltransferase
MYSQNHEDQIISDYFPKNFLGTLVEIGANDGKTLSNSLMLIEQGWQAHLFEPSQEAFKALQILHLQNFKVFCYDYGISTKNGKAEFYHSGSLLTPQDVSLVSTIHENETSRWQNTVSFETREIELRTWDSWLKTMPNPELTIDFISIDAEGEDWNILQQIDLRKHRTKVLCVEWNSVPANDVLFTQYANSHNLFEIHRNAENIIFAE